MTVTISKSWRVCRLRGDDGFTLLAAIAVASVCLLLASAVVAMAIGGNRAAGLDRNGTQAAAAAEGGIDTALSQLRQLAPATQASFLPTGCAQQLAPTTSASGTTTVTLRFAFYLNPSDTAAASCPLQAAKGYDRVVVTSTARQVTGSIDRSSTMTAVVDLQAPTLFAHAVFTGVAGSSTAGRGLQTTGAGLYTNGSLSCDNGASISGVTAMGSVAMYNGCSNTGGILAGGAWTCDTGTRAKGRVIVGGAAALYNSCDVVGGVTAGGAIYRSGSSSVAGAVKQHDSTVSGVVAAARRTMPALTYEPSQWSPVGAQTLWSLGAGGCSLNHLSYDVRAPVPLVIDARACSPLYVDNLRLTTNADITVFAGGLRGQNDLTVTSADGKPHSFRIIVPATSPTADPCSSGAAGGRIEVDGWPTDPLISTFLYTPGALDLRRDTTVRGALYGCTTSFANRVQVQYTTTPLPSGVGGGVYVLVSARRSTVTSG